MAKLAAESVLWDLATEGFQGDRVRLRSSTTARVEAIDLAHLVDGQP